MLGASSLPPPHAGTQQLRSPGRRQWPARGDTREGAGGAAPRQPQLTAQQSQNLLTEEKLRQCRKHRTVSDECYVPCRMMCASKEKA